jgi:hypothetical protein
LTPEELAVLEQRLGHGVSTLVVHELCQVLHIRHAWMSKTTSDSQTCLNQVSPQSHPSLTPVSPQSHPSLLPQTARPCS